MFVDDLRVYLPTDRFLALAEGKSLPDRTSGAALLADLSGFTLLAEALNRALGAQLGAEATSQVLDQVYEALISETDRYGGSVTGFAGDSITCWFAQAENPAEARAAACALALLAAMHPFDNLPLPGGVFASLALKVAVVSGQARRFVVGNPNDQLIDTLAGRAITRLATGILLAGNGEALADEPTARALGDAAEWGAWKTDPETGERFAVLRGLRFYVPAQPWQMTATQPLTTEQLRPWLPKAVYARQAAGQGAFITEFRPVVALFLRFTGIDYDSHDAESRLDAFIRQVQHVLMEYGGTLIDLTIGDKGSYLYTVFGAPISYEDNARRAVHAALRLNAVLDEFLDLGAVQVGISQGILRAGVYGSRTRRVYSVLGDDVNLAARLMMQALPGQVLVTGRVRKSIASEFAFEPMPPIRFKGKAEPLPVFSVSALQEHRAIRLQEPGYALPMIGRQAELMAIGDKLALVQQGSGQVISIVAEAGMGKSRLVAEGIRLASRRNFTGYGGVCQSDGVNTSYLVWRTIWRAFFDVDVSAAQRKVLRVLEGEIEDLAPDRLEALPLLGMALHLPLPENEFTRTLEPKFRTSAMEALLLECLRSASHQAAEAGEGGLLLVLDDLHWIDPASASLLEKAARAIADLPVLILLAHRPLEKMHRSLTVLENLPYYTRMALGQLGEEEAEQVIRAKMSQLYPEIGGRVSPVLIEQVTRRAQGNPFYIEELMNYLRDQAVNLQQFDTPQALHLELPDSLHSLILSRIDQLTQPQQLALKVASIIGRRFGFEPLLGYYPELGEPHSLKANLNELAALDLTPMDSPEPELAYLFKHIVTHEVCYESLSFSTRLSLHERFALYLETLPGAEADHYVDLLAYHYERSPNEEKKRAALKQAGLAAAARYANAEAASYFSRLLALIPETEPAERYALLLARERVLDFMGLREAQLQDLTHLRQLAEGLKDDLRRAQVGIRLAHHYQVTGKYPQAIEAAQQAVTLLEPLGATILASRARRELAWALMWQGEYAAALQQAEASLALADDLGEARDVASAQNLIGSVLYSRGDFASAQQQYEESLRIARQVNSRLMESDALVNLSSLAGISGERAEERQYLEQALQIDRELGNRRGEQSDLVGLGYHELAMGNYLPARQFTEQGLRIAREIGDQQGEDWALFILGEICVHLGEYPSARHLLQQSLRLAKEINDMTRQINALASLGRVAHLEGDDETALSFSRQSVDLARQVGDSFAEVDALSKLGEASLGLGSLDAARQAYQVMLDLSLAREEESNAVEAHTGLARVALAAGDLPAASQHAQAILAYLDGGTHLHLVDEIWVYGSCYAVLRAVGHPRARETLAAGYRILQERAQKLSSEAMRRTYLENVPHHREIVSEYSRLIGSQGGANR